MAIRPLVILPDSQLRQVSAPVETVTPEIRELAADMLETMYDAPGIGLAAVQIGVLKRVVTIDLSKPAEAAEAGEDGEGGKPAKAAEPRKPINCKTTCRAAPITTPMTALMMPKTGESRIPQTMMPALNAAVVKEGKVKRRRESKMPESTPAMPRKKTAGRISRIICTPAAVSSACSHCDNGQASIPIRVTSQPSSLKNSTNASGSLVTFASRKILPLPSTTHTLDASNDTSIPA